MDLDLVKVRGRWTVATSQATLLNANTAPEDARIAALVRPAHEKVLTYVNSVIGTCTQAMSASTSRYQDTAAMDFINLVQAQTVKAALVGTPRQACRCCRSRRRSTRTPRSRRGRSPCATSRGSTSSTTRCWASRSPVRRSRTTSRRRRRTSARSAAPGRSRHPPSPTPSTPTAPGGTPDYNYDIMGGLDARLTYDIDIAKDPGSRDREPVVRRGADRPGRHLRRRDQQLPAGRRRQLPARQGRAGASTTARSRSAS